MVEISVSVQTSNSIVFLNTRPAITFISTMFGTVKAI